MQPRGKEAGTSLIEAIVALGILACAVVSLAGLASAAVRAASLARDRTRAAIFAAAKLDRMTASVRHIAIAGSCPADGWERLDATGVEVTSPQAGAGMVFVRQWASAEAQAAPGACAITVSVARCPRWSGRIDACGDPNSRVTFASIAMKGLP